MNETFSYHTPNSSQFDPEAAAKLRERKVNLSNVVGPLVMLNGQYATWNAQGKLEAISETPIVELVEQQPETPEGVAA